MMRLKTSPDITNSSSHSGSGTTTAEPVTLELVCVEFIGQLDDLLIKAADYRATGRYGEASAAGKQMLLAVLDFAETNLQGEPLEAVQQRVADAYDGCRQVDDLVAAQSWRAVRRVLGKPTATTEDVAQKYQSLGEQIAMVVITAVAGGEDHFHSGSSLARQMADCLQEFIERLKTNW